MDADLARAAGDTLERIARHVTAVEPMARDLLQEIQAGLLEPTFEVPKPAYKTLRAFRAVTGQSPQNYVTLSRLVIAARLLCETGLFHQEIAARVGFEDGNELGNYCRSWLGLNPSQLRAAARAARRAGGTPFPTLTGYRRWLAGELDSALVAEMAARRERIERRLGLETVVSRPLLELASSGPGLALHLRMLFGHPREERLRLLKTGVYRGSAEAFEAISRRSREEGRKDRQRGVEVAEMALALVEGSLAELGERAADGLALGWARLSNARRLASDLAGAEAAMRRAAEEAAQAAEPARAEVLMLRGTLRLFQRRFAEALRAYGEAVALSQAAGADLVLVDTLLQRASVHLYLGEPAEALPDLDKARLLIPPDDERRRLIVVQHSLDAAILSDDTEIAREILPEAQRLSRQVEDRALALQIRWLEGWLLCAEGDPEAAEPLLKEARAGFIRFEDLGNAAVVSLDLALLYHEQGGRAFEVLALASDALPALRDLHLPEAVTASALLHQAIRERKVYRSVLELARRRLLAPGAR